MPGMEEKPKRGKRPRIRPRRPDPFPADFSGIDTEMDRSLDVHLLIPFHGKKAQALKFITETLPRIVAIGIGANVQIGSVWIDGELQDVSTSKYSTAPGVNGEIAQGGV